MLRNYGLFLPQVAAAVTVLTAVARRLSYLVCLVYTLWLVGPASSIRVYPAFGTPNDPDVSAVATDRCVVVLSTAGHGTRCFLNMNGVRTLLPKTCMLHCLVSLYSCRLLVNASIPLTGPRGPYSMNVR